MSKITYLILDANSVKSGYSGTKRFTVSLTGSLRNQVEKVLLPCWRIPSNSDASSRIQSRRNPSRFYGRAHNSQDRCAACTSQKVHYATWKFGKEKIRPNVLFSILTLMSMALMLRNSRTDLRKKPWNKSDVPARVAWELAKHVHKLKEKDKATFYSPLSSLVTTSAIFDETRGTTICARFRSINAHAEQERSEFSGTGLFGYPETLKRLLQPMGKCNRTRKRQCASAILIYSWQYRSSRIRLQSPGWENAAKIADIPMTGPVVRNHTLLKTREKSIATRKTVAILVPGLSTGSSSSTTRTSPTTPPQDWTVEDSTLGPATIRRRSTCNRILGDQLHDSEQTEDKNKNIDPTLRNRLHDLPEWLEDFSENLEDEGVLETENTPASTSRESDSELPRKVVSRRTRYFYSLRESPKLRSMQEDQRTKAPCRKRTGDKHWPEQKTLTW